MMALVMLAIACLLPWTEAKAAPSYELYDYDPVANPVIVLDYANMGS